MAQHELMSMISWDCGKITSTLWAMKNWKVYFVSRWTWQKHARGTLVADERTRYSHLLKYLPRRRGGALGAIFTYTKAKESGFPWISAFENVSSWKFCARRSHCQPPRRMLYFPPFFVTAPLQSTVHSKNITRCGVRHSQVEVVFSQRSKILVQRMKVC